MIEVTSPTTRREDLTKKRTLYARLAVAEYYLYDPLAEYLAPPLQGYRLDGADYRALTPDSIGALVSEALGLALALVEGRLRLFHRQGRVALLSPAERVAAAEATARAEAEGRRAAEAAAMAEAEGRRAAERRIAELEAELRRRGSS